MTLQQDQGARRADVAVVIVNWNAGAFLAQSVRSVIETLKGGTCQIVVVDNASSDGSANGLPSEVLVIHNPRNRGFAAAVNQGCAAVAASSYVLLNPDAVVLPGAIDGLTAALRADPKLGIVGPRLVDPDGTLQRTCSRDPSIVRSALDALMINKVAPRAFAYSTMTDWDHSSERDVDVVNGACLVVRDECWRELNGLDERFYVYFEETDLCRRARVHGWRVRYLPQMAVVHWRGQSSRQNLAVRIGHRYRSMLLYFAKHRSASAVRAAAAVVLLEMVVRLGAATLVGLPSVKSARRSNVIRNYFDVMKTAGAALVTGRVTARRDADA